MQAAFSQFTPHSNNFKLILKNDLFIPCKKNNRVASLVYLLCADKQIKINQNSEVRCCQAIEFATLCRAMQTPPPVRKTRKKMKLRQRERWIVIWYHQTPAEEIGPTDSNGRGRGQEFKSSNVTVRQLTRTNLYFKTAFTFLPLEFWVASFHLPSSIGCSNYYYIKAILYRLRLKMLLTAIPSLPACFYITPPLIYKKGSLLRQLAKFLHLSMVGN